jgi:hypothetical protein
MSEMNTNQIINMLLNKENEISNKFHSTITQLLRLGYETERGKNEISYLIESVKYSLEDIERIINR